jgi:hypothetical protein
MKLFLTLTGFRRFITVDLNFDAGRISPPYDEPRERYEPAQTRPEETLTSYYASNLTPADELDDPPERKAKH